MPKVGAARCGRDGDVLPCRGGWEEAWARSVWVVVGRRLLGSGCVVDESPTTTVKLEET